MARLRLVTLGIVATLAAACGPSGASVAPTAPASVAPTRAPGPRRPRPRTSARPALMPTKTDGKLTIGTDNPAFPPYFEARDGGNAEPWDPDWGDPTTGKGFESAMAYAIAEQLGFTRDAVTWIHVGPSTTRSRPGPRTSTSSSARSPSTTTAPRTPTCPRATTSATRRS